MDFRVDQKGKYYTERVTKETLQVVIATNKHHSRRDACQAKLAPQG